MAHQWKYARYQDFTVKVHPGALSCLSCLLVDEDWALIPADRDGLTRDENEQRAKDIETLLAGEKLPIYILIGTNPEEPDEEEFVKAEMVFLAFRKSEMSRDDFILFLRETLHLTETEVALYRDDTGVYSLGADGASLKLSPSISIDQLSEFYRRVLRGTDSPFAFEGLVSPASWMGALALQSFGVDWIPKRPGESSEGQVSLRMKR